MRPWAEALVEGLERALAVSSPAGASPEARAAALVERAARLAESARASDATVTGIGERLEEMLTVVTSMTAFDYSRRVALREDDDWIVNALAIGLNMMAEELTRATEELTTARDRALAANRAKSAFLANMSHELRTPLNAIIGYSELIREDLASGDASEAADDLGKIAVAAHHLLNLIKDTLDLSKIEAGRMELALEEVDLGAVIDAAVTTIEPMAAARGNRLRVSRSSALPRIVADRLKVQQILYNLLSNATKFTSHGTVDVSAAVEVDAAGVETVALAVEDTGIGIPQDKLSHIFGAFSQADERMTAVYGGTGLGLTISRHFAEMMGGDLEVESTLGVGSRFTVRLPVASGGRSRRRAEMVLPTNALILADRDPRVHDLVRRLLSRQGVAVLSAGDNFEVLNLAAVTRPVAVIIDLGAPAIDGWSLLAALRSGERPVPVIITSELDERARALSLGAAEMLRRPIDGRRLAETVGRFRQTMTLGTVALVAGDARGHARFRLLLEGAGWRIAGGDEDVDAIVVDARALGAGGAAVIDALGHPEAPVVVLGAVEGLARPHAVVGDAEDACGDVLGLLSQVVHRGTC